MRYDRTYKQTNRDYYLKSKNYTEEFVQTVPGQLFRVKPVVLLNSKIYGSSSEPYGSGFNSTIRGVNMNLSRGDFFSRKGRGSEPYGVY